jgi:hypothetical protein
MKDVTGSVAKQSSQQQCGVLRSEPVPEICTVR